MQRTRHGGLTGLPEDHRREYSRLAVSLHRTLKQAEGHFRAGRCHSGSIYLNEVLEEWGALNVHRKNLLYTEEHSKGVSRVQIRFSQRVAALRNALAACMRQLPKEVRR
jgi:hypothetical protein